MRRIIVFGVGKAYEENKELLQNMDFGTIIAFIDNNKTIQNTIKDGISVYAPIYIQEIEYDIILITSIQFYKEQKKQLLELGVDKEKIWDSYSIKKWSMPFLKMEYHYDNSFVPNGILILTYNFGINGGSLAILSLAEKLKNKKNVCIAMPEASTDALELLKEKKINHVIFKSLPYMPKEFLDWIDSFDGIIVNTFQMALSVKALNNIGEKKVVLWVHEGEDYWYEFIREKIEDDEWIKNIQLVFVSRVAMEKCSVFFEIPAYKIIPVGIEDKYLETDAKKNSDKLQIIVIASKSKNKNPKLILEACALLPPKYQNMIDIEFIGIEDVDLFENLGFEAKFFLYEKVKICGILKPAEVDRELSERNCVVCTSLVESLSMAIIEGMMHRCLVIAPKSAGIREYITDGENGFLYETNNEKSLCKKLMQVIDSHDKWEQIKDNARKTYCDNFTLDKLYKDFCEEFVG